MGGLGSPALEVPFPKPSFNSLLNFQGAIVAGFFPILAVVLGLFEFIAADNGDFWRILAAARMGGDLKLFWRFLASFGGDRKFKYPFL